MAYAILVSKHSQAAVARAIGKTPPTVNEYLSGKRSCPQDVLIEIAGFIGCPVSLLERRVRADVASAA
jgi:transcriptional regulator with XRE-family HTH domain